MADISPLVSPDWVSERLGSDEIRLVEVDEDTTLYDNSHLPGAVALHWQNDLQDGVRRAFLTQKAFAELMDSKGITNDTHVVLYGGNNNWFAAYAYWYFKLYGHENVKLLDGGRKKWELDARELVPGDEVPERPKTDYKAKPQDTSIRAFRDDVVAAIGSHNLVDVRSPDEFSGKLLAPAHLPQEQSQRPGHVPSA